MGENLGVFPPKEKQRSSPKRKILMMRPREKSYQKAKELKMN